MKKSTVVLIALAAGVGVYFLAKKRSGGSSGDTGDTGGGGGGADTLTREAMINNLSQWIAQGADAYEVQEYENKFNSMTTAELTDVYTLVFSYNGNITMAPPALADRIRVINSKYEIFT